MKPASEVTQERLFTSDEYKPLVTDMQMISGGFVRVVFGNYGADISSPNDAYRKSAKRAFTALRKDIKAYSYPEEVFNASRWRIDLCTRLDRDEWNIHEHILTIFAHRMAFIRPLAEMKAKAVREKEELDQKFEKWGREWQEELDRRFRESYGYASWFGTHGGNPFPYHSLYQARLQALGTLGLQDGATQEDIKKGYRTLAKKYHPDVGGDAEQFKRISQAYRTLCDRR